MIPEDWEALGEYLARPENRRFEELFARALVIAKTRRMVQVSRRKYLSRRRRNR